VRLLVPLTLAVALAPQAAYPCSQAVWVGPTQPSDGAVDVPTNALLYIDAGSVARWGLVVEATDGSGRMSRTEAVPLSDNLARAPLALRPGQVVALDVFVPMNGALRHSLRLQVGAAEDHTPPAPIARPTLSVSDLSINPCTNADSRLLTVTFTPPNDDHGLAAYTLESVRGLGPEVVAHALVGVDAADPINMVTLTAAIGPAAADCYRVVAHDLAGNTSSSPDVCLSPAPPPPPLLDAGLPLDTGVSADVGSPVDPRLDAGPVRPDASVARDASGPGSLETLEPECGCQSVSRGAGVDGSAVSVLLALVWLARRRRPRDGSVVLGARRSTPPRAAR
jgi:hypothetical protein